MTDFTRSFEIVIDAPVHTVFEYCRDPRRVFAGDPRLEVRNVGVTPQGLGTTARLVAKGAEDATNECVGFVPDQQIVSMSHPKVAVAGMTKEVTYGPTWTWTFTDSGQPAPGYPRPASASSGTIDVNPLPARATGVRSAAGSCPTPGAAPPFKHCRNRLTAACDCYHRRAAELGV